MREALEGKEHGYSQSCATQLAQLLCTFVDGVAVPNLPVSHAKVDIFAPPDFIDFVEAANPGYVVALQHDAADFLSWLFEKS